MILDHDAAKQAGIKADIVAVGYIDENGAPRDFAFDCKNRVAAIEIQEDGSLLYGGYTVDELKTISTQQA